MAIVKKQVRISTDAMRRVEAIAEDRGLRSAMVLDAIIQIGLRETEVGDRYEITSTGLLVTRMVTTAGDQQQMLTSKRPTKPRKARAASRPGNPLTATTSTTQSAVKKPTFGKQQREPQIPATRNTSALTETSPTTQPPASLRITQQLSREQIPEDVYDQLSEYEKECLQYAAFVLDPEEGVILRQDPPINSEGVRATVDAWRLIQNGFIKGDDPDFFDVFKW